MTTVAVVGAGRMGQRHIAAAQRAGHDVCAIYDLNAETAAAAAAACTLDGEVVCGSLDELFDSRKPECVVISTTADSHCDLVCLAAERGAKLILVEKPMATSLSDCDRMIEACRRHGARLSVNHQMRFLEQYRNPKARLESPAFGGMRSMTVVGGNIGFSMNALHYFEAFRYLTGEPIVEVAAWFADETVPNPRGSQFEDRAGSLRAVTATGKRLYMDIGADQGHGVIVTYAGRNGVITVDELGGSLKAVWREAEYRDLPTTRYGMPSECEALAIAAVEVVDSTAAVLTALVTGDDTVTGEQGRDAVAVLAAAYESAEKPGAPVTVPAGADRSRRFPWA